MAKHKVLIGINYRTPGGADKRAEPGDTVGDLRPSDVKWLTEQGIVEPMKGKD